MPVPDRALAVATKGATSGHGAGPNRDELETRGVRPFDWISAGPTMGEKMGSTRLMAIYRTGRNYPVDAVP